MPYEKEVYFRSIPRLRTHVIIATEEEESLPVNEMEIGVVQDQNVGV